MQKGTQNLFYIFGAHSRAQTLAVYLQYLYPDWSVVAYLIDNEEKNARELGSAPVIKIDQNTEFHTEYPVFLATRGIYHDKLTAVCEKLGFRQIYPVTPELDRKLRNEYLDKYYAGIGRRYVKIDRLEWPVLDAAPDLQKKSSHSSPDASGSIARVYVAKSVYDAPLQKPVELAEYEAILQVGAALADRRLPEADVADNTVMQGAAEAIADTADNISHKNRQYCELTGLYWIWKHATEDIVGLEHYRRHFLLPTDWKQRMEQYHIDAILAVPLHVAPSVSGNYRERHIPIHWDYMMECLKNRDLEEYRQANAFFDQSLYSPCNMFIMRKPVLDALCSWLFPILDEVAAHGGECEDPYQNRYPGFLSERLMSFFFEKNRERYKLVYADKNFLS